MRPTFGELELRLEALINETARTGRREQDRRQAWHSQITAQGTKRITNRNVFSVLHTLGLHHLVKILDEIVNFQIFDHIFNFLIMRMYLWSTKYLRI